MAAGEQKTLGVRWFINGMLKTDHFILDVSEVGLPGKKSLTHKEAH